jgi:hypothetical protein
VSIKSILPHRSSGEANLVNIVATLYSGAITTENISVSYLLLWQILESVASSKDNGGKLFNSTVMNKIRELLQQEGYDVDTVQRVNSILLMLGKKNDVQLIAETLWDYLHPAEGVDGLKRKVKKFRSLRGAVTHPGLSRKLSMYELMETYTELRDIVHRLVHKLVCSEKETEA